MVLLVVVACNGGASDLIMVAGFLSNFRVFVVFSWLLLGLSSLIYLFILFIFLLGLYFGCGLPFGLPFSYTSLFI